jgi:hypothetical protein
MGMVKCTGQMEVIIRVNGKEVFNMVMGKCVCQEKDPKKVYLNVMFLWVMELNKDKIITDIRIMTNFNLKIANILNR